MDRGIVKFIEANPGCGVQDIVEGCNLDAGAAWGAIVDAHRFGEITMDRQDDGWHFTTTTNQRD